MTQHTLICLYLCSGKWIRNENGKLIPRPVRYEAVLKSPRVKGCITFHECLGQLFHHFGLDNPHFLIFRLNQSGKKVEYKSSDFFPSSAKSELKIRKMLSQRRPSSGADLCSRTSISSPFPKDFSDEIRRVKLYVQSCEKPAPSTTFFLTRFGWKPPFPRRKNGALERDSTRPASGYDSEAGTLRSWDIQNRCQRSIQSQGLLNDELHKIFCCYFEKRIRSAENRCNLEMNPPKEAEIKDKGAKCSLVDFWMFWEKIGLFEGPYKDIPPFIINQSFAFGSGMTSLFENFAAESLSGRQFKINPNSLELSFDGWLKALESMGRLLFKVNTLDPTKATDRFICEVILPSCAREDPNPVFSHFKRADVLLLLRRYSHPLRKIYEFFTGSCPNQFGMLTPQEHFAFPETKPEARSELFDARRKESSQSTQCGMNVEEFLLFCRSMALYPGLLDEITLRYIFAHANAGWDSDADIHRLSFGEFQQCLCRIALVSFGKELLAGCDPGKAGEKSAYRIRRESR
jgi:hypothetical protein